MSEHHPQEMDLVLGLQGAESQDVEEHLRWCGACRALADEHRWLTEEVSTCLQAEARAAPVPRPRWGDIQVRIQAARRRWVIVRRVSAVASVAAVLIAMLIFSSIVGEPGEQVYAASVEPTVAPQPIARARTGSRTPTVDPVLSEDGRPPAPTPVLRPAPSVETLTNSPSG
ncbi:MAG: hypothetical protein PVI59_13250 [Anaerolineae bacterium]|jgi:predicted anti-sigma-YlaC factor YlaD